MSSTLAPGQDLPPALSLEGEHALVTGASRGLGAAIAVLLAQRGARVTGTATGKPGIEAIETVFREHGMRGTARLLRLEARESIEALFSELDSPPSILVNNAGITRDGLLARMRDADWDAVIDTNLGSVFRMSRSVLRAMMRARKGRIVNLTSVVATQGNPGQANYAAAKAGIIGLTKSLAREVASRGITVNAVAPGFIDTDMTRALEDKDKERLLASIPVRRLGAASDVAEAVAFLASPAASYITGETLHVNGGMVMV